MSEEKGILIISYTKEDPPMHKSVADIYHFYLDKVFKKDGRFCKSFDGMLRYAVDRVKNGELDSVEIRIAD